MSKEKCKYCCNDGYRIPNKSLIEKFYDKESDDYIWNQLAINVIDKQLVLFTEHTYKIGITTKKINYCPMCGRKFGVEINE